MTLIFVLAFFVPLITVLVLTPVVRQVARRLGFLHIPHRLRDVHRLPVSRLGGVALYLSFMMAITLILLLPIPRDDPKELFRLRGVIIGSAILFAVGVYDDWRELSPWPQLAAQFAAALVAIYHLVFIERVNNPLTDQQVVFPMWVVVPFTLFWIMGMINTVNWLDGLDGLAAGVTAIASLVFFAHNFRLGQYSVALLPLALAGSALGFLPFNFHPAKIFMGSSGSMFLGYALGTFSIIAGAKVATVLLVLGVPILDVAWQIINRLRRGRSPVRGDRGHLHHRLFDLGLSQRQVVLLVYFLCAVFGGLALVLPSRLYKLYVLLGMGVVALPALVFLARPDVD
ncbi:MAG: glycosyltransferase family 4 protein [Anaerolineae bacterium]